MRIIASFPNGSLDWTSRKTNSQIPNFVFASAPLEKISIVLRQKLWWCTFITNVEPLSRSGEVNISEALFFFLVLANLPRVVNDNIVELEAFAH